MKRFSNISICIMLAALFVFTASCHRKSAKAAHKVLILGIDGMDHGILTMMMNDGKMPNFSKLAATGDYKPLISAVPAQSPVAWSNFITGMNPGGHGIYDFIHRQTDKDLTPYLSTTETLPPDMVLKLGKYRLPLKGGEVVLQRQGEAFWQTLGKQGIPSVVFKIPANFPPVECEFCKEESGMGTPDVLGTYGTFSYFTDNPPDNASDVTGGKVYTVWVDDNKVKAELVGPPNSFEMDEPEVKAPFVVYTDPDNGTAVIKIGDEKAILKVGQWSDWVPVRFKLAPFAPDAVGIVRIFMKELKPDFKMYVSPINIDPLDPMLPISIPESYSKEIATESGRFYTQGMAEDTKALNHGILNDEEYSAQVLSILEDDKRMIRRELKNFKEGLLFFYFSSIDQNSHTMWRAMDSESSLYTEELHGKFGAFIENLYIQMDNVLGEVMAGLDGETTLIVMSDHGFAPYYKKFNINTWLLDNGYIELNDPAARANVEYLQGVDWSRTKAYNLGINSLYINMRGREANGIVNPGEEADKLIEEIAGALEAVIDEANGKKIVSKSYIAKKTFSGPYASEAPDIVVGFDRGYRNSDDSALGGFPEKWFEINEDTWSGDHCMDPYVVPGILLSNRKIANPQPHLYDMTPTILKEYGIAPLPGMVGKPIW